MIKKHARSNFIEKSAKKAQIPWQGPEKDISTK